MIFRRREILKGSLISAIAIITGSELSYASVIDKDEAKHLGTKEKKMEIKRVGSQPSAKGPSDWFTGTVRIDPLFTAPDPALVAGASVTFEPGARTAWHTHPLGQTLIVTAGCGWAQGESGPIEEIRPGDVVWFAPGEKHWHGAAPTAAFIALVLWAPAGVVAQAVHITPFTGTWKLNLAKSTFNPGPPFKNFTLTFTPDGTRTLDLTYAAGQTLRASLPCR